MIDDAPAALYIYANNFIKRRLSMKCSYCGHKQCDKCRADKREGYCCQCHRTKVMK